MLYGLPNIANKYDVFQGCVLEKQHRITFPKEKAWRAKAPLESVHTDVCRPMKVTSQVKNMYFLLFIEDYARYFWLSGKSYLKGEVVALLKRLEVIKVANITQLVLKIL